jgi:protein-L-isoaspartate(D-aspartate) O-methyltransferase
MDRPDRSPPPSPEDLVRRVAAAGVADGRVLAALRRVHRELFVPEDRAGAAYDDRPVPIPHGQVTTQPSLVARMLEALALEGQERVLEIGTGYGWQTALLARLAADVVSVERLPELARAAERNLRRHGAPNAELVVADGSAGMEARAPFDAIVVAAAFTSVPPPLAAQLVPGGRLVQPIGPGGQDEVTLFERAGKDIVRRRRVTPAHFVRLYGAYGFDAD